MTGSQLYKLWNEDNTKVRYCTIYADNGDYVTLYFLDTESISLGDYDRKLLIPCNYVHVCKENVINSPSITDVKE